VMPQRELGIAVIGDEELVSGLRLAGVSHYHIVKSTNEAQEDVRRAVLNVINESGIGIIALQEDYLPFIEDIARRLREQKKVLPVIIEVPSKRGTQAGDVNLRYRAFIRRFVGFDVEL
jgi:vacuolar-type H+-ATPase subunit F/Vma7